MTYAADWLARSVAAACTLGALALAGPTANASPRDFAQATPAPAVSAPAPQTPPAISAPAPQTPPGGNAAEPNPPSPTEVAEARIADLHTKLQITKAEETQFTAVARVLRANAQTMEALLAKRAQATGSTAVDALRWYERLTETHAVAVKKFVPVFAALYAVLSDDQRKAADAIFQQFIAERPVPAKPR